MDAIVGATDALRRHTCESMYWSCLWCQASLSVLPGQQGWRQPGRQWGPPGQSSPGCMHNRRQRRVFPSI